MAYDGSLGLCFRYTKNRDKYTAKSTGVNLCKENLLYDGGVGGCLSNPRYLRVEKQPKLGT